MKESNETAVKREYSSPDCKVFIIRKASVVCTSNGTESVYETRGQW